MTRIEFTVPVKLESEANAHTHWRVRARRAKAQRAAVYACAIRAEVGLIAPFIRGTDKKGRPVYGMRLAAPPALPLTVTITRIAPRELDSDNLTGSAKHVRDQIAELLGVDDRDPRVTWKVEQARGAPKTYAVRVHIEAREP